MKTAREMTRRELEAKVQTAFAASELFRPELIARDGVRVWRYLRTDLLRVLVWLRFELLRVPLVCNTKTLRQRGFRDNLSPYAADKTRRGEFYVSAHCLGAGVDLTSPDMSAAAMRQKIKQAADDAPCNVRIEGGVNWLHIDTYDMGVPVYEFTA